MEFYHFPAHVSLSAWFSVWSVGLSPLWHMEWNLCASPAPTTWPVSQFHPQLLLIQAKSKETFPPITLYNLPQLSLEE